MRITYALLNAYVIGGTVRTVFNQASALARQGHDVEILSVLRTGAKLPFPLAENVRVRSIVDYPWLGGLGWMASKVVQRLRRTVPGPEVPKEEYRKDCFTRDVERRVVKALRGLDRDVLITTRPALNLLAARYASPTMVRIGQEHLRLARYKGELREAILRDYGRLDALVTLTEHDRRKYTKTFGDRLRVERIPNTVHELDVPQADLDRKVVIAAGRLAQAKGYDWLIPAYAQVAERHPDWKLKIFGDGDKEAEIRELIDRHGMREHILLMGRTNRLEAEFAAASVFVLSSRNEGFGMVVIEAFSHGLPVVCYKVTGPAELVTHGSDGLLVPKGDIEGLAKGIIELIENPELRKTMGRAARETSRQYGPDAVLEQWTDLFERCS